MAHASAEVSMSPWICISLLGRTICAAVVHEPYHGRVVRRARESSVVTHSFHMAEDRKNRERAEVVWPPPQILPVGRWAGWGSTSELCARLDHALLVIAGAAAGAAADTVHI